MLVVKKELEIDFNFAYFHPEMVRFSNEVDNNVKNFSSRTRYDYPEVKWENYTYYQTKTYNNSLKSLYVHTDESKSHLYPIPTQNFETDSWYIRYVEPARVIFKAALSGKGSLLSSMDIIKIKIVKNTISKLDETCIPTMKNLQSLLSKLKKFISTHPDKESIASICYVT